MNRPVVNVPYGYEPPKESRKGTLIYYDAFELTTDEELDLAAQQVMTRNFTKLVLFPMHEESVRRMTKEPVSAYYKRVDRLHEWKRDREYSWVTVEGWEGKRKKYTPIDSVLRHVSEVYQAPYFLYMTADMANLFASFASFEEWIKKIRLLLASEPEWLHPKLQKFEHRWDVIEQ